MLEKLFHTIRQQARSVGPIGGPSCCAYSQCDTHCARMMMSRSQEYFHPVSWLWERQSQAALDSPWWYWLAFWNGSSRKFSQHILTFRVTQAHSDLTKWADKSEVQTWRQTAVSKQPKGGGAKGCFFSVFRYSQCLSRLRLQQFFHCMKHKELSF